MLNIDSEFKEIIPALSSEEFEQLEKNILAEGIREPILLWQNTIIDGHNRYKIAQKHNLEYETNTKEFKDKSNVIEWMILNQFGRRNLSSYQRSVLAIRLRPLIEVKAKEKQIRKPDFVNLISDEQKPINTNKELSKIAGVGHDTIAKVQKIEEKAPEEVKEKLRANELTINQAYQQVKKIEKRKEITKSIIENPKVENLSIDIYNTNNKYRVIYADPPWSYGNTMPEYFTEQADHYTLMSLKEICDMPIKKITENNAVLFLWVTSPILEESFEVIKSWGFKYKSSFIWDKIKHNMGHYNSVRHEFLLICTKGSCQPDIQKLFDSVQSIERQEHSKKPKEFMDIIDTIYPIGKRIELFSRKIEEGWDSFGNQL